MADGYISAVQLPGDNTYDIKDKNAVTEIQINGTAQTKTNGVVNLPAYPSDTKVTQGNTTASGVRPLVMEYNSYVLTEGADNNIETGYNSSNVTNQVYRTNNIYASPANGRLYLSSTATPQMYLKYRTLDYTLADNGMSSEQWVGYRIVDKNSKVVALFNLDVFPDGKIGAFVRAGNYNSTTSSGVSGYMGVFAHKDGSVSYSISHKDKFREAIEVYSKLETETPIRSYLTSTVGHACKNLLDITSQTHNSQVVIESINDKTGSIHISTTGGANHVGAAWDCSFENGHSYVVSFINLLENAHASVTIRRSDTYVIKYSSGALSTLGNKSLTFTFTDEEFPKGAYVSLRCTDGTGVAGAASISQLMLRESTILDDTFEPYQIPTDERFKDYLPLTGGTVTGHLFMSGKRLYLKGTNIDSDEDPSSDTWSNSALDFVDKDNTRVSFFNVQKRTNGSTRLELAAQNNNHYNVIDLRIDKDGDCSYYVSDPAAFRTAIGAGTSSTDKNVAQANSVSGKYRPIMLGYDEYDSTTSYSSDEITNKVFKSSKLSFKPDSGTLGIYGSCVGNTASDLISGKAGVLSYGDRGPQIEFNSAIQDSQAGAIIYTNNDSVATGASWSFVSNQTDWNVISKRFHARTSISIGTELPQTSYTLYINGNTYATDSIFLAKTKGYYLTNSANNTYAAINDNGDNLWVGASSAQKEHHRGTNGQTYISSGWSTKNNSGNDTIFVSVPTLTTSKNTETWSHTAHAVLHNGNTSFTQTLSSGTKIGTIKINGVSTDLYCQTNTNTHRPIQVNGTEILGNNTTALNLKAGSNITLSHSSGTVTITGTNTNTTYTLSTGDSNGQIKVTPSSGNAYNVSVKGLGDRAFDSTKYLPLIGGTATGTINIKSSNLDRDGEAPTSDQTGKSFYFVDKDDNGVGRIYTVQRKTSNKKDLFISVYNASGTSNSIGIRILDDGTQSYYLSNPSAFRSAISAGSIRFLTLGDGNTAGTYSSITTDPASYVFTVPSDTKIVEFFYATNTGGGWGENIDSKRIPLSLLQSQSNTLVTLFLIGDKNWTHTYIRKRTYRITKISNYKYSIAPNNESTDTYNHGATTDLVSTGTFTITKNDNAIDLYTINPIAVYVGY